MRKAEKERERKRKKGRKSEAISRAGWEKEKQYREMRESDVPPLVPEDKASGVVKQ